ncbi:MAG: DUF2382 domain-containing protein [Gemmatimonadota bacterium]
MDRTTDRIVPLDELNDFKVAEGDPDVRGWDVLSADGRKIGDVDNLLVDATAMKVRYLDVDIDDELLEDGADRHILIPIGYARLDEDDDQIFVDSLNSTNLMQIPAYRHEALTRDYETTLRGHFDNDFSAEPETDFYSHDLYDSDRFYGTRRDEGEATVTRSEEELAVGTREHRAGEVDVEKHVETEHVRQEVPTRHEEVVVERRPAGAEAMAAKPRIAEDEVRIPVNEEELVVEKRAVPKEEVVVRKQERIENETVEADLRREQVDVHREGDVDVREER